MSLEVDPTGSVVFLLTASVDITDSLLFCCEKERIFKLCFKSVNGRYVGKITGYISVTEVESKW